MSAQSKICEICGEDVPNLKFKKHMETHSESEKGIQEKVVDKSEPVIADKQKLQEEEAALMQSALAAQAKMLEAPDDFFGEDSTDQHTALVAVHCPESLKDNSEWKAVFGDAKKRLDGYAAKAYLPIVDEKGKLVRDEGGNPMFKVKREIYDARKKVYQKESSRRFSNFREEANKTMSSPGLTGEDLTITKK